LVKSLEQTTSNEFAERTALKKFKKANTSTAKLNQHKHKQQTLIDETESE